MLNKLKNIIGNWGNNYILFLLLFFSTLIEVFNMGLIIPLYFYNKIFKHSSNELIINLFIFLDIELTKSKFYLFDISLLFLFSIIKFVFQFIILNKQLKMKIIYSHILQTIFLNFYMVKIGIII